MRKLGESTDNSGRGGTSKPRIETHDMTFLHEVFRTSHGIPPIQKDIVSFRNADDVLDIEK
jgi:hypothetical protein